jgi:WD40 repeat protein
VDHRADLYSLGCTFYFLLTGRAPFPAGTPVEKLLKHQRETPVPVEDIRRGVLPEVRGIVQRLMAKRPDSRFQSAEELVEALEDVKRQLFGGAGRPDLVAALAVGGAEVIRPASETTPLPPAEAFGLDGVVLPARRTAVLGGHQGYVTALAFSADGRLFASGGVDGTVRLWALGGEKPREVAALRGQLGEVQALAFSPTQPFLVAGPAHALADHMWRWDYEEPDPGRARSRLPGEPARVDALAFRPDGKALAAVADAAVFFWAVSPRKGLVRRGTLKGRGAAVKAFAFAPAGRRLAVAGEDATVGLWERGWFRTAPKAVLVGHADALAAVAYSPDGRLLATGSRDGTVRLWDASGADPAARAVLTGHQGGVRLVRFTPKGDLLVSVGDGGQVFLWDVATQAPVREYAIEKAMALGLALSPDGRYLATGTGAGVVSLYDLELMMVEELAPTAPVV